MSEFDFYRVCKLPDELGGHWIWTGPIDKEGYGRHRFYGRNHMAHRWVWECATGEVAPTGMQLDHKCVRETPDDDISCVELLVKIREHAGLKDLFPAEGLRGRDAARVVLRRCCNPDHLEFVAGKVNTQRATNHNRQKHSCPRGHLYTPANTYVYVDKKGNKRRKCRECNAERARKRRAEEKASA